MRWVARIEALDTHPAPGSLRGPGKHLQKTQGCGLLNPGDTPRVPSTKPTKPAEHTSAVVFGTTGDAPDGAQAAAASGGSVDGEITDPAIISQLQQLWSGERTSVQMPPPGHVSLVVCQSAADDPGYDTDDFAGPGYTSDDFV